MSKTVNEEVEQLYFFKVAEVTEVDETKPFPKNGTPVYKIENELIWGATAMIISEFIEAWSSI